MKKNLLVFLLSVGVSMSSLMAQNHQVYPVFIYSFAKYIKWPDADSNGDFVIGIVGDSPINETLKKMASLKKINTRLIRVVEFQSVDEVGKCHILFIPEGESENFEQIKGRIEGTSTLLLTEKEGMGEKGSAINFVTKDKSLLFEINEAAANLAGLKISSELKQRAILI